ncbi:MAG: FtsW/RodA/SpoVE family cell cycle protein [Oscillospiraceae bacterium]|nr:FtsW/RodA/SpoVE family cell cycle protein [Oscillospiraceae bacterium]
MEWFRSFINSIQETFAGFDGNYLIFATMIIRYILPVLAVIIVMRCIKSLLREKSEGEIWAQLQMENGTFIDLNYWENAIGRSRASDIYVDFPTVSRKHAAVIRDDKGNWQIYDIQSKKGVLVNGVRVKDEAGLEIKTGDIIDLGGITFVFIAADRTDEYEQAVSRTKPGKLFKQHITLAYLTMFQMLLAAQFYVSQGSSASLLIPFYFIALSMLMWACFFANRVLGRVAFEIETIGFFLTTIGMSVASTSVPSELVKYLIFIILGICFYYSMGWFLRDLDRIKKFRRPIAIIGPLMLVFTRLFGERVHGAIRWINIPGIGITFQPSEFVKIAVIFAGAATLERLFARRNLFAFIGLMGACMGLLALMTDFGSALIFFVVFLVIAFLRSGDFATIFLSIAGAGFAGLVALSSMPHIAGRFATWGRAWEFADTRGWQQTRAMSAAASGGLFGIGAGNGWFNRIFAADSDLVFGVVSEELGLLLALIMVSAIVILALYSIHASSSARSSFYTIAACATAAVMVFQMMLNVLGSMDILPFTGVTFPFVSMGGTSLVASWGMLAFFKAVDTRQNASFAVKMPKRPTRAGGGAIIYKGQEYIPDDVPQDTIKLDPKYWESDKD